MIWQIAGGIIIAGTVFAVGALGFTLYGAPGSEHDGSQSYGCGIIVAAIAAGIAILLEAFGYI